MFLLLLVPSTPTTEVSDRIVGGSRSMQSICKNIGRVAPQDINVLVLGESGTGKETDRAGQSTITVDEANPNFLAINCAAIPENLLESELFGHEQGAFHRSGSTTDRQV